MDKLIYEYIAPKKLTYEEYVRLEVPEYSHLKQADLEKIVNVYTAMSNYYYTPIVWET